MSILREEDKYDGKHLRDALVAGPAKRVSMCDVLVDRLGCLTHGGSFLNPPRCGWRSFAWFARSTRCAGTSLASTCAITANSDLDGRVAFVGGMTWFRYAVEIRASDVARLSSRIALSDSRPDLRRLFAEDCFLQQMRIDTPSRSLSRREWSARHPAQIFLVDLIFPFDAIADSFRPLLHHFVRDASGSGADGYFVPDGLLLSACGGPLVVVDVA